ncbi:MAG: hypothetical protein JNJ77_17290 [Planctomycetia bacterium]|nr:hypothetical protein [Planctomycetia bacterium]
MVLLIIAMTFASMQDSAQQPHRETSIAFLKTQQHACGAFSVKNPVVDPTALPSIRATRTAIKAFALNGSTVPHPEKILQFLKDCHSPKTGGFSDRPGIEPDPVSTSVALMILKELNQPVEPYLKSGMAFMDAHTKNFEEIRMVAPSLEQLQQWSTMAERWGQIIEEVRNADGTYGKGPGMTRMTALRIVARQRLGLPTPRKDDILAMIRPGQRVDGGFGGDQGDTSDLESCYRIVRLFSRLEAQPDRPTELRAFIEKCHHASGGYGVKPGDPPTLHGTYYAAVVTSWLNGGK